jgi:hypothetical protein
MENKIIIDENLLKYILDQQSKNIVGKCMKRFELSTNREEIKLQVKELLYEFSRDLKNQILNASKKENKILLINTDEQSKEIKNGRD